ncbi:11107_t:CDS:2 [Ambispora gerdemannii]|uniref:11107_t:CDS:1 n=1 Tax=Ambispora gerdemannii TaxID=144530 RepID=A0A9N9CNN5_9GLOM|nr:11107_t:CDS:2 [Ambispora gerdemannii]
MEIGDTYKVNKKILNYEKAVKVFFTDIEKGDLYDNTEYVIKFLKTTGSEESEMIEYLSKHRNSQTQVILGAIYLKVDEARNAFQEFEKAALMNNPHGQYFLGHCYEIGIGTYENDETAVYWKRKAANQGIPAAFESGYNSASFELAITHHEGSGTFHDIHEAIYWYRKSIKAGELDAYDYLENLFTQIYW